MSKRASLKQSSYRTLAGWAFIASVFVILVLAGEQTRASGAAAAEMTSPGSADKGAVSAEPNSFKQVASHLDTGGNFYLYLSTEQWLANLSDKISGFRQLFQNLPNIGEEERAKVGPVFDLITRLVKISGVEEISGVGLSSIALDQGFYRNKSIWHHYPGQNTGYLWSLFGQTPHALTGLELLPESTALAGFSDFDLPLAWSTLRKETERAGLKDVSEFLQQLPAQLEANTGINWQQLLASIGNEYGLVVTLDSNNKIAVPVPQNELQVPEPGLMLVVAVKNDFLFEQIERLLNQQPNLSSQVISADKDGLKMRTLPVPVPLPLQLRPTLAQQGNYLFLATSDRLVQEAIAVKNGQKPGFKASDEFKHLAEGLPRQGNQFGLLSRKFAETIGQIQSAAIKANPSLPPAMTAWVQTMLPGGTGAANFTVAKISEEGWISIGNGTRDLRASMLAPMAVVPGMLAAIAIPNFVRARSTAQGNACIANLRQLEAAKEMWALENKKKNGDTMKMSDLVPEYIKVEPRCPAGGGEYILNAIGTDPACPNYNPNNSDLKKHRLHAP